MTETSILTRDRDPCNGASIVELFAGGTVFHGGDALGRFKTPVNNPVDVVTNSSSAVCGDYDADGRLNLIGGGENGIALLSGGQSRTFSNVNGDTGKLAYHGNINRPKVIGCVPCDVNNDGRYRDTGSQAL